MGKWTRRAFIRRRQPRRRRIRARGRRRRVRAGAATASSRTTAAAKGELTTWITVTPDNFVTILVPHCEMGQGSQTGLAMMAAEEMEADWDLVRIKEGARPRRLCERLHAARVHR